MKLLDDKTEAYIKAVVSCCKNCLGNKLVAIYLQGSGAADDYESARSDIDLVALVSTELAPKLCEQLAKQLEHKNLACPAKGLDLLIAQNKEASKPSEEPRYELWFSTGHSWRTEIDRAGNARELLIHFAICKKNGRAIFGPEVAVAFGPIPRAWLLAAMREGIVWHQTVVLDPFHDSGGQHGVLNACRALAFAKTGELMTKSSGGEWFLQNKGQSAIVQEALAARRGEVSTLTKDQVSTFLAEVIDTMSY